MLPKVLQCIFHIGSKHTFGGTFSKHKLLFYISFFLSMSFNCLTERPTLTFVIFISFVLWLTSVSPRENRSSNGGESEFVLVILSETCGIAYCTWITSQICHVDECDDAHKALSSAPGIFCVMSMSYNH